MMRKSSSNSQAYRWGGAGLFFAAAVILTALGSEYFGGLQPCPLCLQQRWAYYAGVPLLFLALVLLTAQHPRAATAVFTLVALGFLANAGLGVYHAGAEWKFWPGPDTCAAGSSTLTTGNLLEALKQTRVVRCDEAAFVFAGLSMAGWNVVACMMLFTASLKAAFAAAEHERYL